MKQHIIEKISIKLIAVLLLILVSIALVGSLLKIPQLVFLEDYTILVIIIEFIGALFFLSFLKMLHHAVMKVPPKFDLFIGMLCLLFIALAQFSIFKVFEIRPIEDLDKVTNMAIDLVNGKTFNIKNTYFSMYTNNIPFTLYLSKYFKLMIGLGFRNYTMAGSLLGALSIDIGLLLSGLILNKLKGRKAAVFFLVVNVFNPLVYFWGSFFYTTIIAIPFMMFGIYLVFLMQEEKRTIPFCIMMALFCSVLYIGTQIRATTSFVLIGALFVSFIRSIKAQKSGLNIFKFLKKLAFGTFLSILSLFLIHSGYQKMYDKAMEADYSETAFPYTHWLMMGLQGNGSYSWPDELATMSKPLRKDKIRLNEKEIKKRVHELGAVGLMELMVKKVAYTWSDGSHDYPVIMRACHNYTSLHKYVLGEKRDFIILYCQIFNITLLLLLLGQTISILKNGTNDSGILIYIVLLGGFLFHLLWEANPKYSLNFIMLILIIANGGLNDYCNSKQISYHFNRFVQNFGILFVALSIIVTFLLFPHFTEDKIAYDDPVQGQIVTNHDYMYDIRDGDSFTQSFHTKRPFNDITIYMNNVSTTYNATYLAELLDDENNVLYTKSFSPSSQNRIEPVELQFDTIYPKKSRTYYIKISSDGVSKTDAVAFGMSNKPGYDVFPNGTLTINENSIDGDLAFLVTEKVSATYTSALFYLLVMGSILFLEVMICLYYKQIPQSDTNSEGLIL